MRVPVNIRRFSRQSARARLPFSVTPALRVAQITATTPFDRVAAFPAERWRELQAYRPRVLIGPMAELLRLRERVEEGTVDMASVDYAVVVLTQCGEAPISDVSRVALWQTFGVPVYELLVGNGGHVLASECEAHDGWHVEGNATFSISRNELVVNAPGQVATRTGLLGCLETGACPCGRPGTRILSIEASVPEIALAATA